MYLLLKNTYNPASGTHHYEEIERINNEDIISLIACKYSKKDNYCIIRVNLFNEYLETISGIYDNELPIN